MARRKRDELDELRDRAAELPDGPVKVALLEEAVALADERGDVEAGYEARESLLDAGVMAGRGDLILAHYAWCLARFDEEPDRFDEQRLLWRYKWVVSNALDFPEITLAQINALIDDMEQRFRRFGSGARAVADYRYSLARHVGDKPASKAAYARFRSIPRDELSDCLACEADDAVDHYIFLGQHRKAVSAAAGIVSGWLRCSHVPERTYAALLFPLFRLGKLDEAARMYRTGVRLSLRSADAVVSFGSHFTFLGLTDNLPTGLRLLQKTLPLMIAAAEPSNRFWYLDGATFLLECAARAGLTNRLRVPPAHPLAGAGKGTTVTELRDWADAAAAALAAKFDSRNGTTAFAESLAANRRLHRQVKPFPLDDR
jgi:hypothetical protein